MPALCQDSPALPSGDIKAFLLHQVWEWSSGSHHTMHNQCLLHISLKTKGNAVLKLARRPYICSYSLWEVEAGGSKVWGQPVLHEVLSQQQTKIPTNQPTNQTLQPPNQRPKLVLEIKPRASCMLDTWSMLNYIPIPKCFYSEIHLPNCCYLPCRYHPYCLYYLSCPNRRREGLALAPSSWWQDIAVQPVCVPADQGAETVG